MCMRHSQWKEVTEKLELLHAHPRIFVWDYGHLYGIEDDGYLWSDSDDDEDFLLKYLES